MNSVEDLLKLCNLEQRLLVERVLKFTEDREAKCKDLEDREKRLQFLMVRFFEDHVRRRLSQEDWNLWRDRQLEQYELKRRDDRTGR